MAEFGLQTGTPQWGSAGPIAFGPGNVVFLADNRAAKVIAAELALPGAASSPFDLDGIDARIAAYLGCGVDDLITVSKNGTRDHGPRVKAIEVALDRAGVYVDKPDVKVTVTSEAEMMTEEQIEARLRALVGA